MAIAGLFEMSPEEVRGAVAAGDAVLIDVREPFEHAEVRIAGAELRTLSGLDASALRRECAGRRVVFHCAGGGRSAKAAEKFGEDGEAVYHLAGGIEAWISEGLPVERSVGRLGGTRLPVMRQVQIVAGSLVALGTGLGVVVSPWFFVVPGFVGCGLVFAGVSGFCGMARVLAAMPWNRVSC